MTHFYVLKTALKNSCLSFQVWVAQLDRAECCHKSCSLHLDQTSLWRKAETRYRHLFRSVHPNQRSNQSDQFPAILFEPLDLTAVFRPTYAL